MYITRGGATRFSKERRYLYYDEFYSMHLDISMRCLI